MLGNNMFAYCNNNPVEYIDSSGHLPYENNIIGRQVALEGGYGLYSGFTFFPGRPASELSMEFSGEVYDSADDYPDSPSHVKLLSYEVSALSFEEGQANIISATGTLLKVDAESEYLSLSLYDIGVAEISLGVDNYTVNATAMVTAWNPNVDFNLGICTVNIGANIGSYGVDFAIGKDGITFGAAALFGYSISIEF